MPSIGCYAPGLVRLVLCHGRKPVALAGTRSTREVGQASNSKFMLKSYVPAPCRKPAIQQNGVLRYVEQEQKDGGRNWIRTSEGVSQQIYSLPPLATWVSYQPSNRGGENMLKGHWLVNEPGTKTGTVARKTWGTVVAQFA